MKNRMLSLALVLCLLASLVLPVSVGASETEETEPLTAQTTEGMVPVTEETAVTEAAEETVSETEEVSDGLEKIQAMLGDNYQLADMDQIVVAEDVISSEAPKTCGNCGATEGEPLGHDWVAADCDTPKTCAVCGDTEGELAGHSWTPADCMTAKTCSACGTTDGEALGHAYENGICSRCDAVHPNLASYTGKTISILGDSISTYTGVSNNTGYNSTIGSNAVYYTEGRWDVYQADTWWQQVIDSLGMELLVNNSWSGSTVFPPRKGAESVGYGSRCVNLHNDHTGEEPDVIVVFLGTNDFSYYQSTLGSAEIDYTALIVENTDGTYTYAAPVTSCEAYAIMLHKMKIRYPDAQIFCMTMLARRDPDKEDGYADVGQPTQFNADLAKVIEYFGCTVVDLEQCGIDATSEVFDLYMGDARVHPNAAGMDRITQALTSAMIGEEMTLYDVQYDLTDVTVQPEAHAALAGETFSVTLSPERTEGTLEVTVTMGGADVTDRVWSDGNVAIDRVTGDIQITAVQHREPLHFRWDFDGTDLLSSGDTENTLTKMAGSTTDGVIGSTYYQLADSVQLKHAQPWALEWKCQGTGWSGMVLSAASISSADGNTYMFKTTGTNGFLGFGERKDGSFYNYGIALSGHDIDTDTVHTYRIENHIASDGSNMVYLYVDGSEIGPMNHYFIGGSSDQNQTVDWLSGKDFVFSYMGASGHTLNNCQMEYIEVWETHFHSHVSAVTAPTCTEQGYTTYTCECGDSYVADRVPASQHDWQDANCTVSKTCSACGATEGEPQGHSWIPADCDTPKTCSACGATEGDPLGHDWVAADCDTAKTCKTCGTTEGDPLGHDWAAADCDTPKTCKTCGETDGEPLGHDWTAADCVTAKTCKTCGETDGTPLGHDWVAADCDTAKTCKTCGTTEGDPLGHDWAAADCVTPKTCKTCGETDGDPLGHRYDNDRDAICNACSEKRKVEIVIQTTPMYRLYNPNSGEHFYTGSFEERKNLVTAGWQYEGIAWNAPTKSGDPVYRVYNPNSGDHHYTMSWDEVNMLTGLGWKYEGVAWNSAGSDNVPQYRLYNPNADCGSHHYTGSEEERDFLVSVGWIFEGIGWFGMLK